MYDNETRAGVLTRILNSKNAAFQKKLVFHYTFLLRLCKSQSQRQKVGVKYSKFGVNEKSGDVNKLFVCLSGL